MKRLDLRRALLALALLLTLGRASFALAGDATTELLGLVPPDAGVTLAVTDLRGHAAAMSGSTFGQGFAELPAVKHWRASVEGQRFNGARAKIESMLGAKVLTIQNDLLGDAVVLSLHLAPGASPDSARGLLLTRVRDRALLKRLIDLANKTQNADVTQTEQGGRSYFVRRSGHNGNKESDYYCLLDDGTFAWSNSETLIRGVLGRRAGVGSGLGEVPAFRKVRAGLPARCLAFVHIDPKFAAQLLASAPRADDPNEDRAAELVGRYLGTVEGIGLALEWRDGFLLHSHEVLDPKGFDPRLLRWAKTGARPDALARRIPNTAIATAAVSIDVPAAYDVLFDLVPSGDRPRIETVLEAVRGFLLGRELRKEILPRVGPAVIAYVEAPASEATRLPIVGVVELRGESGERGVAAAIDNALRTLCCLYALDPRHQAGQLRVESQQRGALRVTSFGGPNAPFAYGLGPDCLVVGTSADAVARFGTGEPDARLAATRSAYFPDARAYAAVDVPRVARAARSRHDALARHLAASRGVPFEEAAHDLDGALALFDLFDTAFFALAIDDDLTSVHQTLGLVARTPSPIKPR
jgi:hypothetical protein